MITLPIHVCTRAHACVHAPWRGWVSLEARVALAGKQKDSCLQYNVPALLKDETRHVCKGASHRKQGWAINTTQTSCLEISQSLQCVVLHATLERNLCLPWLGAQVSWQAIFFAWARCYTGRLGGGSLFFTSGILYICARVTKEVSSSNLHPVDSFEVTPKIAVPSSMWCCTQWVISERMCACPELVGWVSRQELLWRASKRIVVCNTT